MSSPSSAIASSNLRLSHIHGSDSYNIARLSLAVLKKKDICIGEAHMAYSDACGYHSELYDDRIYCAASDSMVMTRMSSITNG